MNSFFCNVLIFRSSRSQIFFKIDVLKISASFTGKQLCWSLFLIKLLVHRCFPLKLTEFFYEQFLLQNTSGGWFCGFSSKNNIISSVIMITLGYNKKLSWKYCDYHHPSLQENIHLLSKVRPSMRKNL